MKTLNYRRGNDLDFAFDANDCARFAFMIIYDTMRTSKYTGGMTQNATQNEP